MAEKGLNDIKKAAANDGPRGGVLASLSTRGFVGHPGLTIGLATIAGLGLMNLTFLLGLPFLFSMAGLFAGILLVFGFGGGEMRYTLTTGGLERSFRPFAAEYIRIGGRRQTVRFSDIRSYRRDRDLGRDKQEYAFLRLKLRKPPFRMTINSKSGRDAFEAFADAFEAQVSGQGSPAEGGTAGDSNASKPSPVVRREKGFYDTWFAKGLTIVFAVVAVVLSVLQFTGTITGTNLFRLTVIIIPGVLYMAYRCFGWRRP